MIVRIINKSPEITLISEALIIINRALATENLSAELYDTESPTIFDELNRIRKELSCSSDVALDVLKKYIDARKEKGHE